LLTSRILLKNNGGPVLLRAAVRRLRAHQRLAQLAGADMPLSRFGSANAPPALHYMVEPAAAVAGAGWGVRRDDLDSI